MKNKIVVNFFYQASYQLLLIILPIITIPIVSKALGTQGIGTFNYVNSVAAYFILVSGLGMANYGVREVSIARGNRDKLSKKFWELQGFNVFFSAGTLIIYFIFCFFMNEVSYFLVTSMTVASCIFDITWFFSGIEDFKLITIRNFVIKIISFSLIVLFIKNSDDLLVYFLITSLSLLISQLSMWFSVKKYVDWKKVSLSDCFSHFKPALEFFVAKIAVTLYQNTTKTILGLMTTMSIVGLYSNAFSLVLMSTNIINAMNTVMIPRMSNLYGNNDEKSMIKLLQKSIHLQMFFTIAIAFGITLVSGKMVPWFFGEEFDSLRTVIPLLSPVVVTQSFQMSVAAQYLIPRKDMREYNISIFSGAILTTLVSVFSIPFIGIYGAVAGINLGYLLVSVLRLNVLIKETEFRLENMTILKYIISGIVMLVSVYFFTLDWSSTILTTLIQIIIGSSVYMFVSYAFKINPIATILLEKLKGSIK